MSKRRWLVALCCALNGPAWSATAEARTEVGVWRDFVQVAPTAGAPASRPTELRLSHDGRSLHIRVHARDPRPADIVARQMRRDAWAMLSDDHIAVVIDPDGDGRNGLLFAVNPQGAQFDALVYDGGTLRDDWDALWQSEARIDADGWHADLTIPLAVFGRRSGEGAKTWRFNAERWMPRGNQRVRLAGARPDKEVYSLGDALPMPAIRAEREGWGLHLKPSLRATAETAGASDTGRARQRLEPGLELFHETAAGLRTSAALNLDFGEAEADERTVNLTRFDLFLPEKRGFFLRDAGHFSFGGPSASAASPYYSRRIGLDETGRARHLDAGLKFSGELAGFDFGLLGARVAGGPTDPGEPDQRAADTAVVRVARPLGSHGRLGLIGTRGNPQGTGGSHLWGMDYQYRDTDWHPPGSGQGGKTLETHAWRQTSANTGLGTDSAWGASLSYPNLGLTGSAEVQRVGERFNPALGYLSEAGVVRGSGDIGWWHRTEAGVDIVPGIDWNVRRTLDGRERSWLFNPEIAHTSADGDLAMAELFFEGDRTATAYTLVPGVTVVPGNHRWHALYGYLQTSASRPVWVAADLRAGGYYDGRRNDQSLTLAWQPSPHWGWQLGTARNALRLPSGAFTVRTASLRLDHTPSTRWVQSLLLQWDNVSKEWGASARLRWSWASGRELIAALDHLSPTGDRLDAPRTAPTTQTRALIKLVWAMER